MASPGMRIAGFADVMNGFQLAEQFAREMRDTVYIVGTNVEYAAFVEFGTSRMQAQPFLFPAARKVAANPGKYGLDEVESGDQLVRKTALAIEREATSEAPVDTGRLQASITAVRV